MIRHILSLSIFIFSVLVTYSQKSNNDIILYTIGKTKIEQLLKETNVAKKVEFIEVEKIDLLNFQIIVVNNLKTGAKSKGLYLSNKKNYNFWTSDYKDEKHAFLDESELDELIEFLANCDSKWKYEKPKNLTQYEFETLDNLKIAFGTTKNKSEWYYEVKFSNYVFFNTETLEKSKSDELLNAFIQVKAQLNNH